MGASAGGASAGASVGAASAGASAGGASAATNVANAGKIEGLAGYGIRLVGNQADSIRNSGIISGTVGAIDASTMRRPATPCTRPAVSTTLVASSVPIRHEPTPW